VSGLSYGVGLFPTEPLPEMIRLAQLSEALGFRHLWIGDSHLIWREAYIDLTAMALNTSRVTLGTGVTNPVTRHPAVTASALATLDEAAPGRVILGIGLGDSAVETMGMKPSRLAAFEQTVHRMRALLAGEEVAFEHGSLHLKHAPRRQIPIYVAASGPKMLELAGRIADGVVLLVGIDPDAVRQAAARIQVGAHASGRELSDLHLVLWVPCAVSDRTPAKAAVKAHVARVAAHPLPFALDEPARQVLAEIRRAYNYYQHMEPRASQAQVIPDWLVDRFAIAGTPAECRARMEALQGSCIEQIAIIPYGVGEGDRAATLRGFASAVRGLTP
jgi:5,10-methylenetetrahydromethanopterin reductase